MKIKLAIITLVGYFPWAILAQSDINKIIMDNPQVFKGLPLPYSGIKVAPLSEMNMSDSMKKEILLDKEQLYKNGFIEREDPYPRELLSKSYRASYEIKKYQSNLDPYDTHLKEKITDVKLAFTFKGIPSIPQKNILGYAAVGMWKKTGWTGISEFFDHKIMGTCVYTLNNNDLTGASSLIAAEIVRYDVNNKPTIVSVHGSHNSGFMYEISWDDKHYSHELECANMQFNTNITDKMIAYARVIDKQAT